MSFREIVKGILTVPVRGKPPKPPEGYEADPRNPFIFYLKVPPCDFRRLNIINQGCCGSTTVTWCDVVNQRIDRNICNNCKGREEWICNWMKKSG
jgi:hypothetical protein